MLSLLCDHEHPLVDSLVDYYKSHSGQVHLVVELLHDNLKLRDLLVEDVISHSLSDSISVDDDLVWQLLVPGLEALKGLSHADIKLLLDNLLTLGLKNDIGIVLGVEIVGGGSETYNGLSSSMAHINTDDHNLILGHELWHSHFDGGSSDL